MPNDRPAHRMVVFMDMLGFSRLVVQYDAENQGRGFKDFHLSSLAELDEQLRYTDSLLERQFAVFHGVIETHVRRLANHDAPHSVTFSDSAFIAFHYPVMAYRFAVDVMRDLILRKTPVRMGLAEGSFWGRRFSSDTTEYVQRHSFQFFGTGVIGAYKAEGCGIKGMRILLHPGLNPSFTSHSIFSAVTDPTDATRPLTLPVTHELSYVQRDYPMFMRLPEDDDVDFDADPLTIAVALMARAAPTEPDVQIQYLRTQEAIVKMRGSSNS